MTKALLVMMVVLLLGAAHAASAQDVSPVRLVREQDLQLTPAQEDDLTRWIDDVRSYHAWYERYRNRVSRNIFGFIDDRRMIPPVLEWLPARCELAADFVPRPAGPLAEGCDLLSFYESNVSLAPSTRPALLAQKQNEQDPHSSFWKHLHLDAGWTSLDYRLQAYGVVGVHVTLPELAKRVQIYLPPGFLLLSVPDGRGGRTLEPAATVGVSIKMFGFAFPQNKAGTAYFNIAKAYVVNQSTASQGNSSVDLVGLSFAWGQ